MMKPNNAALDFKGIALLIILCASWGLNQVAIKLAIQSIPPILQAGIRSMGATVLVFIWMKLWRTPVLAKDTTLWWGIGVGVWIAFITYIAWFWLIRNYAISRLASFTFLTPIFGVIAGAIFLNEPITRYLVSAFFLVGTGIFLVNRL